MHQHTHHDTSTQAMTEVALGLSMAFFSLLILTLFSISLPDQTADNKSLQKNQPQIPIDEQLTLASNNEKLSSKKPSKNNQQQFAFYLNGQFYDKKLNRFNIDNFTRFDTQHPLIVAVQDSLPLIQIMALRKKINHPHLSITMLNEKWQTQLEKMQ